MMGLPVTVEARSESAARHKLLRRWLRLATVERGSLPLVPTLILLASDDPRITDAGSVCDARLAARSEGRAVVAEVHPLNGAVEDAERGLLEAFEHTERCVPGVSKEEGFEQD